MSMHPLQPRKRQPRQPVIRRMIIEAAVPANAKIKRVIAEREDGVQIDCNVLSAYRPSVR